MAAAGRPRGQEETAARFGPTAAAGRPRGTEVDRRRESRSSATHVHSIAARIRGGHDVILLDVSASGARVEGTRPLRPGARVDVHLSRDSRRVTVPARVVRSLVAAIDADHGITYQAALSFERRCDWLCEEDTPPVSSLHNLCSP
jgi:PilZ domain